MEADKNKHLWKYLVAGGALGFLYFAINYLASAKKVKAKPLSLDKTKKVLRQIKYQMLTTCFTYAEAVGIKQKGRVSEEDLEIAFRTELAKVCETHEDRILNKYELSKDEYSASLEQHRKNPRIQQEQAEILDMMERAIKGRHPDLIVPPQASQLAARLDLITVYLEMCEKLAIRIWQKLDESKRKNPGFNSRDELHYKKAMRELNIYDVRCEFLEQKGFDQAWGSPIEVFIKLLEACKLKEREARNETIKIQKAFDMALESIMNQPQNFNAERIKFFLQENLSHKPKILGDAIKPQPAPPGVSHGVSKSLNQKPAQKKQDQELSLDNLMMQELLSRSAEDPKPSASEELQPSASEQPRAQVLNRQAPIMQAPIQQQKIAQPESKPSEVQAEENEISEQKHKKEQSKEAEKKAEQNVDEKQTQQEKPEEISQDQEKPEQAAKQKAEEKQILETNKDQYYEGKLKQASKQQKQQEVVVASRQQKEEKEDEPKEEAREEKGEEPKEEAKEEGEVKQEVEAKQEEKGSQ